MIVYGVRFKWTLFLYFLSYMPPISTLHQWKLGTQVLDCSKPQVIGILNLTPDSFSDGGKFNQLDKALARAEAMAEEGAKILDLGAESSRPGALTISVEEEWQRLQAPLKLIRSRLKIPLSVDTRKGEIAQRALSEGADIINDISGGRDLKLLKEVAQAKAGLVLMHTRGEPADMMEQANYQKVDQEVLAELKNSFNKAIEHGVAAENICLDPGFGFAKKLAHNLKLFSKINPICTQLKRPLWVGVSRKRMIKSLVGEDPHLLERASVWAALLAASQGASFLRVHEVGEMVLALKVLRSLFDECNF